MTCYKLTDIMKHSFFYLIAAVTLLLAIPSAQTAYAQEPFIGEIRPVGFTFCPRGWAEADGQLLAITNYEALFSLYGTIYGGDGRTTFGLPDLRGRAAIHTGQGPGLSDYSIGEKGGAETVLLTEQQMPVHNHSFTELTNNNGATPGLVVRTGGGEQPTPTTEAGGSQAHENRPPFLTIRYCVALVGIYPSRN